MNRRLFPFLPLTALLALSTAFASPSENKALVTRLTNEFFNAGRLDITDQIVAPNYIQHALGIANGREALKVSTAEVRTAFPDLHYTIEQLVSDGEYVAARFTITGTHRAPYMGINATNKSVSVASINIWRIQDGQLTEHWEVTDTLALLTQLGVLPANNPASTSSSRPATLTRAGTPAQSKRLVLDLFMKVFNAHNVNAADVIFPVNYIQHNPAVSQGLAGFKTYFKELFIAFPDAMWRLDDVVAKGDLIFVRNTISGTHRGAFGGIPATNKRVEFASMDVFRVEDGKLVEHWDVPDNFALLSQLGVIPSGK